VNNKFTPTVSVIVPNYNHARFLRQRLDSILHQKFQDFELILLDDCSTDDSRLILSEYERDPRVRMQFNGENSGSPFRQWNKGVWSARGKYIWIAESDDYADERLLGELVSRLDNDSDVVLCNSRSWRVTATGEIIGFLDSPLAQNTKKWTQDFSADGREECQKYLVYCCTILNASSVLFRKDTFDQVGGADRDMRMCGDWKLWAAMALRGKIAYVGGTPLNYHREHNASATSKSLQSGIYTVEYLKVVNWILQNVTLTEEARQNLCDYLFEFWYPEVLTNRISLRHRRTILANARAIDRRALRKLIRPGLASLRLTLLRRWLSFRSGLFSAAGSKKRD
jgi:glycosyltransferase involved in cell wall biosynthesis